MQINMVAISSPLFLPSLLSSHFIPFHWKLILILCLFIPGQLVVLDQVTSIDEVQLVLPGAVALVADGLGVTTVLIGVAGFWAGEAWGKCRVVCCWLWSSCWSGCEA